MTCCRLPSGHLSVVAAGHAVVVVRLKALHGQITPPDTTQLNDRVVCVGRCELDITDDL